ncbi:MAG: hypothetical protein QG670_2711 [Thermoproteota archaeon]|nr:hypothetical protein [Thermoproteota archaeon]
MAENENGLLHIIDPWYKSLENPEESQRHTFSDLIAGYSKTRYGKNFHAGEVSDVSDFRRLFPTLAYKTLNPYLNDVMRGDFESILSEPLICWVMTRGSTGTAKVLPVTKTHLEQIFSCGSRALINYVLRKHDSDILSGKVLNFNLPSNVHTLTISGQSTMNYGYSSGTYARLNPVFNNFTLLPRQEEIDALGSGITKSDWERRFELVYQRALNENVTAAIGVAPVIQSFARYVVMKHAKKPGELWHLHALFCTSVRNIPFRYATNLRKHFGQVPVVEIYSATEGVFAQQIDDLPYVTPNYDKYFFEVETSRGTKMLYELKRGEWGRLIVSSCMFPRYDIGDLIEAAGKNYFRVFGRRKTLTILEHRLYRLFFGWLL